MGEGNLGSNMREGGEGGSNLERGDGGRNMGAGGRRQQYEGERRQTRLKTNYSL